jgi:hypothetical protein
MKVEKIEILDGWVDLEEKLCREVEGTIVINDTEYEWNLWTDDGFTRINVVVDGKNLNLEEEDDLEEIGLTENDGFEIYDEILDLISEDYSIENWDE